MEHTNKENCYGRLKLPTVYVLMRLYCPNVKDSESFFIMLNHTLKTILDNKKTYIGRLVLLVNDDTKGADYKYKTDRDTLLNYLFGKKGEDWVIGDYEGGGMGSSYAMFKLRELFVKNAKKDNDIAVLLDQDDELKHNAVWHIVLSMRKNGVVVSPFKMHNENNLDITDDGGRIHNHVASRLRWCWHRQLFPKRMDFRSPLAKRLSRRFRGCASRFIEGEYNDGLSDLSSIGWTKSYSKSILARYHNDLSAFIEENHGGTKEFFMNNTAYEDFIDYYVLLYKDVKISGIGKRTHNYIKNDASITAKPKLVDFTDTRTNMLLALIDLCYTNSGKLRKDFEPRLLRYLSSKVCQIESILRKYNIEYLNCRNPKYSEFANKTLAGQFIDLIYERASEHVNFNNLIGQSQSVYLYRETVYGSTTQQLKQTVFVENKLRELKSKRYARHLSDSKDQDVVSRLMSDYRPPHKKQWVEARCGFRVTLAILLVAIAMALHCFFCKSNEPKYDSNLFIALFTSVATIGGAVLSLFYNQRSKLKTIVEEEKTIARLYYSEFEDVIRHIGANLKVMIQIRKVLSSEKRFVSDVHLQNLSWPESSTLFSDEMTKIIGRDRVDDFARLRVNLRNINNSSKWLQRQAVCKCDMTRSLDWEITRHFGYLVNMYYIRDNDFQFPTSSMHLVHYMNTHSTKNELASLFMDYPPAERMELVKKYINRYFEDRNMVRSVLVE